MYFDAFADMLDGVEPLSDTLKKILFCDFYEWIKHFSQLDKQQSDKQKALKTVMKSAIELLCRHMNLFQDLLYPDCMYWHDIFQHISLETTSYGVCGQRALKRFYRVIGQILTNQNTEESKNILLVR